jgi:hypothetical protein
MRKLGLLILLLVSCKSPQLSTDTNNRQAFNIYKENLEGDAYKIFVNSNSSYALCILNDLSEKVSEPITFLIVNIKEKEKVLVSINKYHNARWIDNENLIFTLHSGAPKNDRSMKSKPQKSYTEYIYNVISKQIRPLETEYDKQTL